MRSAIQALVDQHASQRLAGFPLGASALPLAAALTIAASACAVNVDLSGTQFSCAESEECPGGQSCIDEICIPDEALVEPDADVDEPEPDADEEPDPDPDPNIESRRLLITGPDSTDDTYLESDNPTAINGFDSEWNSDAEPVRIGLLRFDIAELPKEATVTGATLTVTVTNPLEEGQALVFLAAEDWDENTASFLLASNDVPFITPGNSNVGEVPAFTAVPNQTGELDIDIPVPVIEAWRNGPNFGLRWTIQSQLGRGMHIASSESGDPNVQPKLDIDYDIEVSN